MEFSKTKNQESKDELQRRINELSPDLQAEFLQATDLLLQRESEIFLKMIRESRDEINSILQSMRNEQSGLLLDKGEDDIVNSTRVAKTKLVEFVEEREKTKKYPKINYVNSKEQEAIESYLKAVGRHKDKIIDSVPDYAIPNYARPASSGSNKSRPGTAYRMRMNGVQPVNYSESVEDEINKSTTSINKGYNKEQEELMNKLKEQDTQVLTERERQMKLIEKKKAARQNKKTDNGCAEGKAANLIDQSKDVDEKQLQYKLQQEMAIQEKLEKARRNRSGNILNQRSPTFASSSIQVTKQNSLFEESKNDLTIRPNTGGSKSPIKGPEQIKLKIPTKSGWSDSDNTKDVSGLFEASQQYPQLESVETKIKVDGNEKSKLSDDGNDPIECITIED